MNNRPPRLDARIKKYSNAFVLGAVGSLIAGYVFFGVLFHSALTGQDELPNYREQYAAQMAAREKAAEEKRGTAPTMARRRCVHEGRMGRDVLGEIEVGHDRI